MFKHDAAVVIAVRAFGNNAHPTGDTRMFALFATLIVVLSWVATLPVSVAFR